MCYGAIEHINKVKVNDGRMDSMQILNYSIYNFILLGSNALLVSDIRLTQVVIDPSRSVRDVFHVGFWKDSHRTFFGPNFMYIAFPNNISRTLNDGKWWRRRRRRRRRVAPVNGERRRCILGKARTERNGLTGGDGNCDGGPLTRLSSSFVLESHSAIYSVMYNVWYGRLNSVEEILFRIWMACPNRLTISYHQHYIITLVGLLYSYAHAHADTGHTLATAGGGGRRCSHKINAKNNICVCHSQFFFLSFALSSSSTSSLCIVCANCQVDNLISSWWC